MPPLLGNVITAYFNERKKTFEKPKILGVNNMFSYLFTFPFFFWRSPILKSETFYSVPELKGRKIKGLYFPLSGD